MQAVLAKDHPGGTEQRPSVVARCVKGSGRPSGLKYSTCSSPMRIADRANSAEHRGAFRADERQKVTSASYQTYRHARASTITTRTIIKLISAHKLSVRLSPLLSLCIVMTSLQDASPTVN